MAKIQVLVVEDEVLIHGLLQEPLEEGGFTVDIVTSGTQAIAVLETPDASYRAVITDVHLGRGQPTGWDVARRARELEPGLAIIYVTGDGAGDYAANGVPNSVLLNKPFAPAQLVAAVAQLLNAGDAPAPG